MGIDAKDVQVFMWRILKFSIYICSKFVEKHPFISSVLLLLFVLYLFLPKVFFFLIYFSPFLVCTVVFIKFYLHSQSLEIQSDVKDGKKDHAISDPQVADLVVNKYDKSCMQPQTTLHRNVKQKEKEMEAKNMVSSTVPTDDSISRACLNEEKQNVITEKKMDSFNQGVSMSRRVSVGENIVACGETSKCDSLEEQAAKCNNGGSEAELESSSSEEEDEEKAKQECKSNVVEWTEDDQKNLMDLGNSELERNKRLESLIARRKVRKLFKMQTEKILIHANNSVPIPVAPVIVARGDPLVALNNAEELVPGSAPSILLPRNPFDLPYDPLEEKPNLMADSFQQEFMPALQKDMFFCRHESFSLGSSFLLEGRYNDTDIEGQSRFRRQTDKGEYDLLVENILSQDGETLRRSLSITDLVTEKGESSNQVIDQLAQDEAADHNRIQNKVKSIDSSHGMDSSLGTGINAIMYNKNESSSSSLSEDNEQIINQKKIEVSVFTFPSMVNDSIPNPTPCPLPKAKAMNELPNECSPSTFDRSRLENHLLYTNNGPWHTPNNSIASDMQVEVSEVGSPPLEGDGSVSSNDGESLTYDGDVEKEITSGSDEMWGASPHASGVNEVTREDIKKRFLGFQKGLEDLLASSSGTEIAQKEQTHIAKPDHKIFNDVEQVVDGGNRRSSNALHAVPSRNSMERTYTSHEGNLHKPHESVNTPEHSIDKVNINYNMGDQVNKVNNGATENMKSSEEKFDRIKKYIEQDVLVDLSKRAEESTSESSNYAESNSNEYLADQPLMECVMPTTEDKNSNDGKENSITTGEFEVSQVNQDFNDPSTSSIQPEIMVEQISTMSDSSSSPTSVLPDRILLEPTSSDPNLHMQTDAAESYIKDKIVRNKVLDEQILENSSLTAPQIEQHAIEDSTNHPSIDSKFEKPEEAFNTLGKSIKESNVNKPVIYVGEARELSRPYEKINYKPIELIEGASANLTGHEASIDQSIPEENHFDSKLPELTVKEEELKMSPTEFTEDVNANLGLKDVQNDSIVIIESRTEVNPSELAVEGDQAQEHMPVNVGGKEKALLQNSGTIDDAIVTNMTSNEKLQHVADDEGESQRLDKTIDGLESSKAIEDPTTGSIKDIEVESRNLTEDTVNTVRLLSSEESNNSNNIRNMEDAASLEGSDSSEAVKDSSGESRDLNQNRTYMDNLTNHITSNKAKAPISEASDGHTEAP